MSEEGKKGSCESERNCLKYLKRGWNKKEGRGNKDFKIEVQDGSRGKCLKKVGAGTPLRNMWLLEHMSMVWSALKETCQSKLTVAKMWLDIPNEYGSIPLRFIFFGFKHYSVDPHWISIIKKYYSGIYRKSFSKPVQSTLHQYFRGIFAECTVLIVLFLADMNVIIEYALKSNASQFIHSGKVSFPLAGAFMEDINLMSVSIPEAQDLVSKWTEARSLLGMSFRAGKSRIVRIIKGKLMITAPFDVSEPSSPADFSCYIPSIHLKPGSFLGRIIDGSCQTENQSIFLFQSSSGLF